MLRSLRSRSLCWPKVTPKVIRKIRKIRKILTYYFVDTTTQFLCLVGICVFGYPALYLVQFMANDFFVFITQTAKTEFSLEKLVAFFINWSHTPGGRFLPLVFFGVAISFVTGVSMVGLLLTSACVGIVSVFIFIVVISRMGYVF